MAEPQHEAELREILGEITQGPRTIAFVGIKDDPQADAYRIPRYMQEHGYRIVPVLGIQHGASAARLRAAGIRVVQDRCIMVEHGRLLGPRAESR